MNTSQNTTENAPSDQSRPFGFWISAVDRLTAARFATAFEDEGISRRDWRILNAVEGTVPPGRELPDRKLRRLAELGWVERTAEGWALTPDGAAAKARLRSAVEEIRAEVTDVLGPEEFAALAASLEKLARGLGYEEGTRLPRRPHGRRGDDHGRRAEHHGRGHHHGAHTPGHGFEHGRFARGRFEHHGHECRHGAHAHGHGFPHGAHAHGDHTHGDHAHGHDFRHGDHGHRDHTDRDHAHRDHTHGRGPHHHRRGAEHIHIHLHHGRRDG